jgi:dienelactone hydrolase
MRLRYEIRMPTTPTLPTRSTRPLLTWDRTPGFLCDWHVAGFFDSGLRFNPEPNLFDAKLSDKWRDDHLAPWGGCAGIRDVPNLGPEIAWDLMPLSWTPQLSLRKARDEFPDWQKKIHDVNPDAWTKLYYALALVESPAEMQAELFFSGWDGCRLWINGELRFEEHSFHHCIYDMERLPVTLKKGINSFLFQLDRDGCVARLHVPGDPAAVNTLQSIARRPVPKQHAISTFVQMRRYARSLSIEMPFTGKTPAELHEWQQEFSVHYHRCLGPAPAVAKRKPVCVDEKKGEGFTQRRYHLPSEGEGEIPLYVLTPDADRRNGRTIVLAHGHERQFDVLAGTYSPKGPHGNVGVDLTQYAKLLAQKGFVTSMMCERGFCERRDYSGDNDPCDVAGWRALAMGLTLPRLHLADLHAMHEFVCTLPEVDGKRLGIGGLSGGGTLSYLSGAFDDRFKAVCVMCGMCRYEEYAVGENGCGLQIVPGLYPTGDVGELLGLIAPRPLLLGQGRLDSTFNVISFKSIAEDAARAYSAAGVSERLEVSIFELAHQFNVDVAEKFFLKWL